MDSVSALVSLTLSVLAVAGLLAIVALSVTAFTRLVLASVRAARELGEGSAAQREAVVHAAKALLARLFLALTDYFIKLFDFLKSLLLFPVGLDYRHFKARFSVYDYTKPWPRARDWHDNVAYLPLRADIVLLCSLCVLIPLMVYTNTRSALTPFMATASQAYWLAFVVALGVYLCDVVIVRSAINLVAERYVLKAKARVPGPGARLRQAFQLVLRLVVVACTAVLLGFGISPSFIESALSERLQTREHARVLKSEAVGRYEVDRQRVVEDALRVEVLRYCANYAFSGAKDGNLHLHAPQMKEVADRFPSFAQARARAQAGGVIDPSAPLATNASTATVTATGVASAQPLTATAAPASATQDTAADARRPALCAQYLQANEPVCRAGTATRNSCPNAYALSAMLLREAAMLHGVEAALAQYNRNAFKAADLPALGIRPVADAAAPRLLDAATRIRDQLDAARNQRVDLRRLQSSAANTGEGFVDQYILGFFRPLQIQALPPEQRLDVDEVADALAQRLKEFANGRFGFLVPLSVVVLLGVVELLVIMFKTTGMMPVLEKQRAKLVGEFEDMLLTGVIPKGSVLESESKMKSDWSVQDHFHDLAIATVALLNAAIRTPYQSLLVMLVLGITFVALVVNTILGNQLFRILNLAGEVILAAVR